MKNLLVFLSFPVSSGVLIFATIVNHKIPVEPFIAYLACYGGLYGYGKWVDMKSKKKDAAK